MITAIAIIRIKIITVPFFIANFDLLSCEFDKFTFEIFCRVIFDIKPN